RGAAPRRDRRRIAFFDPRRQTSLLLCLMQTGTAIALISDRSFKCPSRARSAYEAPSFCAADAGSVQRRHRWLPCLSRHRHRNVLFGRPLVADGLLTATETEDRRPRCLSSTTVDDGRQMSL